MRPAWDGLKMPWHAWQTPKRGQWDSRAAHGAALLDQVGTDTAADDLLPAEADPSLADLLWWQGERLAMVEIAIQVNGENVRRAVQRAETLRRGGIQAIAVVIGESWATPDTRERTCTLGIEWKVSADLSTGFLAFRRLPAQNGA